MPIPLADTFGFTPNKPNIDKRYLASNGQPYASVAAAETALASRLVATCVGLTVLVADENDPDYPKAKEYWVQPKGTTPETYGLVVKGAGTTDYAELENKPTINNVPLSGNKTASDLRLATAEQGGKADTAIQGVSVNGTEVTPDPTTKKVALTIENGKSAYQLYLDNYEDEHGSTDGALDEAAWLESLQGKSALQIYNETMNTSLDEAGFINVLKQNYPMEYVGYNQTAAEQSIGTAFAAIDQLAASASTACKLYLMPNDGTTPTGTELFITVQTDATTYMWYRLGALSVPSNVLTEDKIVQDLNTGGADKVLSAEAGKIIGDRVFGESTKAVYTPVSGYVVGRTGAVAASSSGAEYCEVELAEDVHDVKFYGIVLRVGASGVTSGYAFGHYTDPSDTSTWVSDYASEWDYEGSANGLKSYVVHKPSMATHFRTCCKLSVAGGTVVLDDTNFYIYLQTGYPLVDKEQLNAVDAGLNGNFVQKSINLLDEATNVKVSLDSSAIYTSPSAPYRSYEVDLTNYKGVNRVITIVGASSNSTYFCFTNEKINDGTNQTITGANVPKAKCGVPTGTSTYRTGLSGGTSKIIDVTDDAKYLYISKKTSSNEPLNPQSVVLSMEIQSGGLTDKVTDDIVRASEDNVNLEVDFVDGLAKITHYTGNNAVVADGMTLTDIFETNNMAPIYPGFDNGSFAPMVKGNGTPYVTSEMSVTGRYSLKSNDVNGVKSSQIHTQRSITPAMQVFAACKINVTSYTAGRYGINAGTYAQVYKDSTTDGWETISDIITTGTGTYLFFGGWSSSEGVAYIDSPVVIDLSIFTETPTVVQLTSWYEQYIAYKQTLQEIPLGSSEEDEYSDEDCRARFIQEMNTRAARIGMSNTTFVTASGYSANGNFPVGTASDYIKLMLEAMSHLTLMKIWGKATWSMPFYDASAVSDATETLLSSVVNPNDYDAGSTPRSELTDLLAAYNILGGKTGTTGVTNVLPSGTYVHNLCVVAEKNGRYVIAVVFGADYVGSSYGDRRFGRMKVLLDNAFGLLNDSSYTTQAVLTEPSGSGIPSPYPCSCAAIEVPNIEPSMLQDFTPTLLYSENPDRQVYLASTSKTMTCLLVEEILPLWQKLLYKTIDDVGGSADILDNGDIAMVEDMMMAAMLPSSNGCANCLGRVAGKVLLQRENSTKVV